MNFINPNLKDLFYKEHSQISFPKYSKLYFKKKCCHCKKLRLTQPENVKALKDAMFIYCAEFEGEFEGLHAMHFKKIAKPFAKYL